MPLDLLRRKSGPANCRACGASLPAGALFCPTCGVRVDDPDSDALYIVDRHTGLFNDRFIRPVLEDELARAHRYQRPLGVLLVEAVETAPAAEGAPAVELLKTLAAGVTGTLREVDTPGVLSRSPVQLLCVLPDTDIAGTAHAAHRTMEALNLAVAGRGASVRVGLVCVRPGQRMRAGAVIEAAARSLRSGKPEMVGR